MRRIDLEWPPFTYDYNRDLYVCPAGNELMHYRRQFHPPRTGIDAEDLMR